MGGLAAVRVNGPKREGRNRTRRRRTFPHSNVIVATGVLRVIPFSERTRTCENRIRTMPKPMRAKVAKRIGHSQESTFQPSWSCWTKSVTVPPTMTTRAVAMYARVVTRLLMRYTLGKDGSTICKPRPAPNGLELSGPARLLQSIAPSLPGPLQRVVRWHCGRMGS